MPKKVKHNDYKEFKKAYDNKAFKDQRLGQAFINHFFKEESVVDPELFYEETETAATAKIFNSYIAY